MRLLAGLIKQRPKNLLAVYVESDRIEVVQATRKWRTWHVGTPEVHSPSDMETVYESLQRLNLKPRDRKGTALVLFLPRLYYSFHCEQYPVSLTEQLEEALQFDWQENTFFEQDRSMNFFGSFVPVDRHLSVPIFSLQFEIYEKFEQALAGSEFQSFTVLPSALAYKALCSPGELQEEPLPIEILGRVIGPGHMEINRFYNGQLLDSLLLGRNGNQLRLFAEHLQCIGEGTCQEALHIHILCSPSQEPGVARSLGPWEQSDLPVKLQTLDAPLIEKWVKYLLQLEGVTSFTTPLVLKPWEIPKVAWGILGVLIVLFAFSMYQVHVRSELANTSRALKKEIFHLETQWKPIEQLQTRISKFQEDQKTLTQFNSEGYPLMELLSFLSQITPEDTWLNYVSLRKGQLVLRGESKSAIKYLSELTKVEGFSDVRFASPVTRNPASDLERFNVQMQIDAEKLKKPFESLPSDKEEERPSLEPAAEGHEPTPPEELEAPAAPGAPPLPPLPPPGMGGARRPGLKPPPMRPPTGEKDGRKPEGMPPPPPPPPPLPPPSRADGVRAPAFRAPPMQPPSGEEEFDEDTGVDVEVPPDDVSEETQ